MRRRWRRTARSPGQVFHGAYTWAAWYLRFCVQQEQVLSLPEAVRRLTSRPAERIGIPDRGVLRPAPTPTSPSSTRSAFREEGTTFDPSRLATGMDTVVVNGVVTLSGGMLTGSRNGAVLRRG